MPKTKRQFCVVFQREDGHLYGDTIPADTWEEAEATAKLLYGPTAKVSGQLSARIPVHKDDPEPYAAEDDPKFYDDDGKEITEELWRLI